MKKSTVVILNQLNIKNNKSIKTIVKKNNHVEEHCSYSQCFKEKNYKTKFLTSSIYKKKIDKDNYEKKTIKKEKNHVGKYCSNP
jgi:hypothetical protein